MHPSSAFFAHRGAHSEIWSNTASAIVHRYEGKPTRAPHEGTAQVEFCFKAILVYVNRVCHVFLFDTVERTANPADHD